LLVHFIKEEYERRHDQGEPVAMAGYFERFPELRDDLIAFQSLRSWEARLTGSDGGIVEAVALPPLPSGYRFVRELPRGGMSRLLLVETARGTLEVLKQIDFARGGDLASLERFENEISLARGLAAKGVAVVPVSWVGQVGGRLSYTMPYCAGGSLRDLLKEREGKPLDPLDAAQLILTLARTVQRLQAEQPSIVHRDLKPENVLFPAKCSDSNQPLIADLGLAKVLGREGLTSSATALGTWPYMAPEQVRESARVDGRADNYTLGVILYECLTGRRPFDGKSPPEIIHRIYHETPLDPSKLVAGVPEALDRIVQKCLQKEVAHRYATARELADDLQRFLGGDPVQARLPGRAAKILSWGRRYPKEALAYAAALAALILGLAASIWWAVVAAENARRAESQAEIANREALRADDNAGLINRALGRLVERIGRDQRLRAAGLTSFRNELLHDAVNMYSELAKRNSGEGNLGLSEALNNQALLLYLLGDIPGAADSAHQAELLLASLQPTYEARVALADARRHLGVIDHAADEPVEGLKKTQDAIALYQALIQERPSDHDVGFHLALAIVHVGNYAMDRDPAGAMDRYRQALALFARLRREAPNDPRYVEWEARTKSNLGLIVAKTGTIEEAIESQREAVAAAEQVSDDFLRIDALATCRNNLAEALESGKKFDEAERIFRQSLGDYRTLTSRFPKDVDCRWGVAMTLTNVAALADHQGRSSEALGLLEEAKKLFDGLLEKLGKNEEFVKDRGKNLRILDTVRQHLSASRP
jgi:tetratricopeptide (TPR) repeat protein